MESGVLPSKAMCLDPFRVVLILGQFLGVEALIFTVATTQMQVRLPVPQAGGFFFTGYLRTMTMVHVRVHTFGVAKTQ